MSVVVCRAVFLRSVLIICCSPFVMVDPGLLGDVRQGQLYLQLDAIDESDRIWEFAEFSF